MPAVLLNARLKAGCLVLEGLNAFATTLYFYYLYFFMHQRFGFDNKANLLLAAASGFVYAVAVLLGGKFAQRAGYFTALKLGTAIMIAALAVGAQVQSPTGHVLIMMVTTVGMCFTWPALEALVSEGESPVRLARWVGCYNVVWAGSSALAYFCGGAVIEAAGPRSLFFAPIGIFIAQLALLFWMESRARRRGAVNPSSPVVAPEEVPPLNPRPVARARTFLRMAWFANPFAYIAINTLIAVMPGLATRLGLSTAEAGLYGSLWCFARLGAFFGLWFWPGWHYRLRWLLAAYAVMVGTFAAILIVSTLPVWLLAQVLFGAALGLIYYSSLFYSMDVGETKGEHGGIHEAAIGLGNCVGPAVGAAALHVMPHAPQSGPMAVSLLLLAGLGGLIGLARNLGVRESGRQ
ncbi:MAG: MFS transporter [Verrucomicrobiae bacterium]|nr:MFS transporter [Verrucomicrobiae bacterium]